MKRLLTLILALLLASCSGAPSPVRTPAVPVAPAGGSNPVADTVNRYRAGRGLAPIALSRSLNRVAAAHVADLEANYRKGSACNMHSWSARGNWSSCCYTPDHAQAACMWNKPKEISNNLYQSPGYEIVAHYSDPMTPAMALQIWRESPNHHVMIVNGGRWADNTWRAMGAAMGEHYAVVWFGEETDPAGS